MKLWMKKPAEGEHLQLDPDTDSPKKVNKSIIYFVIFVLILACSYAFFSGGKKEKKIDPNTQTTATTQLNNSKLQELEEQQRRQETGRQQYQRLQAQAEAKNNAEHTANTRSGNSQTVQQQAPAPTIVTQEDKLQQQRRQKEFDREEKARDSREKSMLEANRSGVFFNLKNEPGTRSTSAPGRRSTERNGYYNTQSMGDGYIQVIEDDRRIRGRIRNGY